MDNRFRPLFDKYNGQLKPLVAQIEGRFERFETPLLENLMLYWEAIVQLHDSNHEDDTELMIWAEKKLDESISQSHVYMISGYIDDVKDFERHTSMHARRTFQNGLFLGEYKKLKKEAVANVKLTNQTRKRRWNLKRTLPDFLMTKQYNHDSYVAYRKLSEMINDQDTTAFLYRSEQLSTIWTVIGWIAGIGISILAGIYVKPIFNIILQWL